jgi:Fis family transcriptional regulator|tara:strand:- start:21904 stop:22218 length:315 start_codon:yes stop_codon:yes gene_type:complete
MNHAPLIIRSGRNVVVQKDKKNKTDKNTNKQLLSIETEKALKKYLSSLNGYKPVNIYQLIIGEIEKPMLKTILEFSQGNQSNAADILGISRGTLRKKLKHYNIK